jgi:PAS domain S-box-containing protein
MKIIVLQSLTSLPIFVALEKGYFQDNGLKLEISFCPLLEQIEKKLESGIYPCGEISFVSLLKKTKSLSWKNLPFYLGCILSYSQLGFYSNKNLKLETIWKKEGLGLFLPVIHYESIQRYFAATIIKKYFPIEIEPVALVQTPSNLLIELFYSRYCFGLAGDLVTYPFLQKVNKPQFLAGNFLLPNTCIAFSKNFLESNPEKAALFIRSVNKAVEFLHNSNTQEVYEVIFSLYKKNIFLPFETEDIFVTLSRLQTNFKDIFYTNFRKEYYRSLVELVTPQKILQEEYLSYLQLFERGMNLILEGSFPVEKESESKTDLSLSPLEIKQTSSLNFSSEMYKALFKESSELLLIFRDSDMGIVDANKKFCQEIGYSLKELFKMSIASLFVKFDKDNPILEYMKYGVEAQYISNQEIYHRNGIVLTVDIYINTYKENEGKKYLVSFINNTEKKEAMRLKHEFISNISHELRSPMTNIKGYFELLSSDTSLAFKKEHKDSLDAVFRNIKRMNKLIDNLLQLGQSNLPIDGQVEIFDPVPVIEEVIFINEGMAKDKGLEIKKDLQPGLLLDGNKFQFSQVITNLFVNAIKYTSTGSVTVSCVRLENNLCQIKVIDTGIGIDSKYHLSIFERFFRVPDLINRKVGGTGIGLSISQEIISKMGGILTVESELGKGSTFTVLLPIVN